MNKTCDIAKRAAAELRSASEALVHANALLGVIQRAIATGETDQLSAIHLAEIAIELTNTYAERAEAEAEFFDEVTHD